MSYAYLLTFFQVYFELFPSVIKKKNNNLPSALTMKLYGSADRLQFSLPHPDLFS